MAIGSSFVFITPLTYTEFGQILDAYYGEKRSLAVHKLMSQFKEKPETYEQKIPSLHFSVENAWQKEGVRWVKSGGLNGRSLALSHLEEEIAEFELPEELADHIAKRKPVLITHWW